MIRILCQRRSQTGNLLREKCDGIETPRDLLVNWTGGPVDPEGQLVLNAFARSNKLSQAIRLTTAGIPTITVSFRKEGPDWYARRSSHQQGFDFTNKKLQSGRLEADYFVKKEELTDEWRVHVFRTRKDNMRVLRCARKVPNSENYHPWVRSHRLGWKLSYVGGIPDVGRSISRSAVRALLLDFGAVDIGFNREGNPLVLEVNTCPGLEGGTLDLYAANFVERAS